MKNRLCICTHTCCCVAAVNREAWNQPGVTFYRSSWIAIVTVLRNAFSNHKSSIQRL